MNLQEAIKHYHDRGFNLIPLAENSKVPYAGIQLEKYFTEQYPIEELLKLSERRKINLGVITGKTSNLAVIDIDTSDKTKLSEYLALYPTDLIDRTPVRGGWHLYYEFRDGLPEILKIDAGDFYAGSHYVVIAPSVIDGKTYEWIKQGSPGKLPAEIFNKTFDMQSGKYTRQQVNELINQAVTNGLVEGQWNDTILYGSMVLLGDGWNKEAVYAFMMTLNKGSSPIPARQVRSMIERASDYASKNTYQKELPKAKERAVELGVSSYGSLSQKYSDYEAKWLIDGWILESAIIMLAAAPERYKTWLSVDLALSVASGLPFLDIYEVNKPGSVLILQQEDFGARYFSRFKAVERAKLERAKLPIEITEENGIISYTPSYDISNKIYFHENAEFSLDNEASIDRLEQRIEEVKAVLVIIDPFYSLSSNDDYFAKTAEKIRERIKRIRNNTGAAFLFIHHNNKASSVDGNESLSRKSMFGSQFVNAVMEGTWIAGRQRGMGNNQVLLARSFKDEGSQPIAKLTFNINMKTEEDDQAYFVEVEDLGDDIAEQLRMFLRDNGSQSFGELFDVFSDKFSSRSAFSRWLKSQLGNGIRQDGGAKGKYSIEPDST